MFLSFDFSFQSTALLQKLLRLFLIIPETRGRSLAFNLFQLFPLSSNIKETSRAGLRVGVNRRRRFSNLELIMFRSS